jgi:cytochrome P450
MTVREGQIGVALFDDQFIQDPYPLYERMHAGGPDFSSNLTASMTYQDGKVGAFTMGELGGDIQALATADDPAHAEHRKLLVPQLAARRINALEPFIGETADRLWDEGVRGGTIE